MGASWDMHFDRRVSEGFLAHFASGGQASCLTEYARYAPYPVDLQFRRDAKTGKEHASLYVGLTAVLQVHPLKGGQLRVDAHESHKKSQWFKSDWSAGVSGSSWRGVEYYLDHVIPVASEKYGKKEGAIQSAMSSFPGNDWRILDRESVMAFRDQQTRNAVMADIAGPIVAAVQGVPGVPGKPPQSFGGECDLLALDGRGRLLCVEVKPRATSTIRWAAAQATVYAEIFRRWLAATDLPAGPHEVLGGMAEQRERIGLVTAEPERLRTVSEVVPVVAVQRGGPATYTDGLRKVQDQLVLHGVGDESLEAYSVGLTGERRRLD